jgi:hypothetical protein
MVRFRQDRDYKPTGAQRDHVLACPASRSLQYCEHEDAVDPLDVAVQRDVGTGLAVRFSASYGKVETHPQ